MLCHFCGAEISEQVVYHHVVPTADGGAEDGQRVPCHRKCHNDWHRARGDYARWQTARHADRVAMFGAEEVRRLLAHYGRRGWQALKDKRGQKYLAEFHRAGGRARAANGRDERGRFVASAAGHRDDDHLLEAF